MFQGQELRLFPRNPYRQSIQLERSFGKREADSSRPLPARGLDISPQGLGLATDFPLIKGEVVKVYISVTDNQTPIPVLSEVRWAEGSSQPCRAGLKFLI